MSVNNRNSRFGNFIYHSALARELRFVIVHDLFIKSLRHLNVSVSAKSYWNSWILKYLQRTESQQIRMSRSSGKKNMLVSTGFLNTLTHETMSCSDQMLRVKKTPASPRHASLNLMRVLLRRPTFSRCTSDCVDQTSTVSVCHCQPAVLSRLERYSYNSNALTTQPLTLVVGSSSPAETIVPYIGLHCDSKMWATMFLSHLLQNPPNSYKIWYYPE